MNKQRKKSLFLIIILIFVVLFFLIIQRPLIKNFSNLMQKINFMSEVESVEEEYKGYYFNHIRMDKNETTYIKLISLEKESNPKASDVLAKYLVDGHLVIGTLKEIREITNAVFYDLNEDGEDEIIGICYKCGGSAGENLFILEKINGKYKDMSGFVTYYSDYPIAVLSTKTQNYRDLEVTARTNNSEQNFIEANGFMHMGRWMLKLRIIKNNKQNNK